MKSVSPSINKSARIENQIAKMSRPLTFRTSKIRWLSNSAERWLYISNQKGINSSIQKSCKRMGKSLQNTQIVYGSIFGKTNAVVFCSCGIHFGERCEQNALLD